MVLDQLVLVQLALELASMCGDGLPGGIVMLSLSLKLYFLVGVQTNGLHIVASLILCPPSTTIL